MENNDLSNRFFEFSIRVIKFLRTLPNDPEYVIIKKQLVKSASSLGANYEESQAASSKADFQFNNSYSINSVQSKSSVGGVLQKNINKRYYCNYEINCQI